MEVNPALLITPILLLPILLFSVLGISSGVGFETGKLTKKEKSLYLQRGSSSIWGFGARNAGFYGRETHLLVGIGGSFFYLLTVIQAFISNGLYEGPVSLAGLAFFVTCIAAALTRTMVRHLWAPKWARTILQKQKVPAAKSGT